MNSVTFYYNKENGRLCYFHDLYVSSWPYSFLTNDYLRYPPRNLGSKGRITLSGRNLVKCLNRVVKERNLRLFCMGIKYEFPMSYTYFRKRLMEEFSKGIYLKTPNSLEWIKQYADI